MLKLKEIATPFALLLPILFQVTLSLQYSIKTFISDENMIKTESYNSSEVKLQNLTIKTQFITLKKNLGLSGIIEKVSLLGKKLDGQNLLYTSYVGREVKIISEVYSASGEDFYSFHATSCSMVSFHLVNYGFSYDLKSKFEVRFPTEFINISS